jgi:hypothetical protein
MMCLINKGLARLCRCGADCREEESDAGVLWARIRFVVVLSGI